MASVAARVLIFLLLAGVSVAEADTDFCDSVFLAPVSVQGISSSREVFTVCNEDDGWGFRVDRTYSSPPSRSQMEHTVIWVDGQEVFEGLSEVQREVSARLDAFPSGFAPQVRQRFRHLFSDPFLRAHDLWILINLLYTMEDLSGKMPFR